MTTSKSKLIAVVTILTALMRSNAALAGNHGNGGGGSGNKHISSVNVSSLHLNNNPTVSNKFVSSKITTAKINTTSIKSSNLKVAVNNQLHLNQSVKLKKDIDFKKDMKKDFFCKNDFKCHDKFCWWWNFGCYPHNDCYPYYYGCYPYSFSCYYPLYSCYSYCGLAYEPFHCSYIVLPGDSFYTISQKEYGTSVNGLYIARFNSLPMSADLAPGQTLMLPSISANKTLSVSGAPAAVEAVEAAPVTSTDNSLSPFIAKMTPSTGAFAASGN